MLSVQFLLVLVFLLVVLGVPVSWYSICLSCKWKLRTFLQYYINHVTHHS